MNEYKIFFGYAASVLAAISIIPYFISIYRGVTKPHAFTWLLWGVLNAIGIAAQTVSGAGPGTWAIWVSCLANFTIAAIAFRQRRIKFTPFDWVALVGALAAIACWYLTSNPLTAIILISISDAIAFLPTFRKSYLNPFLETTSIYLIEVVQFTLVILAIDRLDLTTWLYPFTILALNLVFVLFLMVRRRQVKPVPA